MQFAWHSWFWAWRIWAYKMMLTALQNHNIIPCRLFFVELNGKSPRQKFERNTVKQTAENGQKKSWVMMMRLVLHHWYQASRIRHCGMTFNSTGRNRFTTAGRVRPDSGWSWTFRLEGKVAPLTSQTLARVIFPFSVWPSSRLYFDLEPSRSDSTEKKSTSDQSLWFWSAVFLQLAIDCMYWVVFGGSPRKWLWLNMYA